MSDRLRMLVSHSTRDTRVRVLWQFVDELQVALDMAGVPIQLVNAVSECGTKEVPGLPEELSNATAATDFTMMVLTQGYVDSPWCDDEMHGRAQIACPACPSHRLFPLAWRTYPWDALWSRSIEGWGVSLQDLMSDQLLDEVEEHLWEPEVRPAGWHDAIARTSRALSRFHAEIQGTCTRDECPKRIDPRIPLPRRLD
jgi:hypothetical protein